MGKDEGDEGKYNDAGWGEGIVWRKLEFAVVPVGGKDIECVRNRVSAVSLLTPLLALSHQILKASCSMQSKWNRHSHTCADSCTHMFAYHPPAYGVSSGPSRR